MQTNVIDGPATTQLLALLEWSNGLWECMKQMHLHYSWFPKLSILPALGELYHGWVWPAVKSHIEKLVGLLCCLHHACTFFCCQSQRLLNQDMLASLQACHCMVVMQWIGRGDPNNANLRILQELIQASVAPWHIVPLLKSMHLACIST